MALKIFIKKLFGRGNTSQPLDGGKILAQVPSSHLPLHILLPLLLLFEVDAPKTLIWSVSSLLMEFTWLAL